MINAYNYFSATYENITLIGDFNIIPESKKSSDFCEINKLEHLLLKPSCFKDLLSSAIDLSVNDHKESFMSSDVYEAGISDHNKMIISVLRKTFADNKPKTVFYRWYKHFDQDSFNEILKDRISLPNLSSKNYF